MEQLLAGISAHSSVCRTEVCGTLMTHDIIPSIRQIAHTINLDSYLQYSPYRVDGHCTDAKRS